MTSCNAMMVGSQWRCRYLMNMGFLQCPMAPTQKRGSSASLGPAWRRSKAKLIDVRPLAVRPLACVLVGVTFLLT